MKLYFYCISRELFHNHFMIHFFIVTRLAPSSIQLVFVAKKLEHFLKPTEVKPHIIAQQCLVYHCQCGLCDADYVGYTARHIHQRIVEHKHSAIGKHLSQAHGNNNINEGQLTILKKYQGKFDCLVYEMLFI